MNGALSTMPNETEESTELQLYRTISEVLGFTNITLDEGSTPPTLFGNPPPRMITEDNEGFRTSIPKFHSDLGAIWQFALPNLEKKYNNDFEFEILSDWLNGETKDSFKMGCSLTMYLSGRRLAIYEFSKELTSYAFCILLCRLAGKRTFDFEDDLKLKVQDINFNKK